MKMNLQFFGGRGAGSSTNSVSNGVNLNVSIDGRQYSGRAIVTPAMVKANQAGAATINTARDLAQQELGTNVAVNRFDAEARGLNNMWSATQFIKNSDGVQLGRVDVEMSYTDGKAHIEVKAVGRNSYINPATGRTKSIKNPISDFNKSYAATTTGVQRAFKDAGKWYKNNK